MMGEHDSMMNISGRDSAAEDPDKWLHADLVNKKWIFADSRSSIAPLDIICWASCVNNISSNGHSSRMNGTCGDKEQDENKYVQQIFVFLQATCRQKRPGSNIHKPISIKMTSRFTWWWGDWPPSRSNRQGVSFFVNHHQNVDRMI